MGPHNPCADTVALQTAQKREGAWKSLFGRLLSRVPGAFWGMRARTPLGLLALLPTVPPQGNVCH